MYIMSDEIVAELKDYIISTGNSATWRGLLKIPFGVDSRECQKKASGEESAQDLSLSGGPVVCFRSGQVGHIASGCIQPNTGFSRQLGSSAASSDTTGEKPWVKNNSRD
jgi:hypothetical protein